MKRLCPFRSAISSDKPALPLTAHPTKSLAARVSGALDCRSRSHLTEIQAGFDRPGPMGAPSPPKPSALPSLGWALPAFHAFDRGADGDDESTASGGRTSGSASARLRRGALCRDAGARAGGLCARFGCKPRVGPFGPRFARRGDCALAADGDEAGGRPAPTGAGRTRGTRNGSRDSGTRRSPPRWV